MYNGIGLRTVRGTATSGHVQRNRAHVPHRHARVSRRATRPTVVVDTERQRKRAIENELLLLREELEQQGVTQIEERINAERQRRLMDNPETEEGQVVLDQAVETHQHKLAKALNIPTNYRTGDAFRQQQQKQKRDNNNDDDATKPNVPSNQRQKRTASSTSADSSRQSSRRRSSTQRKKQRTRARSESFSSSSYTSSSSSSSSSSYTSSSSSSSYTSRSNTSPPPQTNTQSTI